MTEMTSRVLYVSNKEENSSLISTAQVEFHYIQEISSLKSQKFTIPKIDASW